MCTEKLPGSRRMLYHPETELEKVIRGIIQTHKRREWDPVLEHVEELLPQLRSQRSKDAIALRARQTGRAGRAAKRALGDSGS